MTALSIFHDSNKSLALPVSEAFKGLSSNIFKYVESSQVETLLSQYAFTKAKIINLAELITSKENSHTLNYFLNANTSSNELTPNVDKLFSQKGAIKYLDATFWRMAFDLTDVSKHMPAKRRNEWQEMLNERTTLPFEADTVYATLKELLCSRDMFLAEKVDGIFSSLSGACNKPAPRVFEAHDHLCQ